MTIKVPALRRFMGDRRGAVMPIVVAAIIPAISMLGAAIDTGRAYMAKSQLQAGVDAAALAGARAFALTNESATSRTGQVSSYFTGNFPAGYLDTSNLQLTSKFETTRGINITTVTATVDLPMMFMGLLGFDRQQLTAVARAELQPRPMEVMVVLDNTGSMKTLLPADKNGVAKSRINATKDAAKSFIDILFQGAETRPELALGFISYDITVNVGALLTQWKTGSVKQLYRFNDPSMALDDRTWPKDNTAWKGCVFADQSVSSVDTNWTYREPGAWDIDRTLPGEGSHPPVDPYFIPPFWVPKVNAKATDLATQQASKSSDYYNISPNIEQKFNLYNLAADSDNWLNKADNPYRLWFYRYYIGLNNGAETSADDVITKPDGSYFAYPQDDGKPFAIRLDRVPRTAASETDSKNILWKAATRYEINPRGGETNTGTVHSTPPPSPNWQCPDAAYPVAYGRSKSFYKDEVIDKHNGAIFPANGTLHHAGLLWGYRLLVRDDAFQRQNPTNEKAKRALVFMTDGETALGAAWEGYYDRTFTFYGNYADWMAAKKPDMITQSERRFSKTCASLQAEKDPPKVYIVSLATKDKDTIDMFERCAPGRVYQTSDTASLRAAFDDIASELVDLHLTK